MATITQIATYDNEQDGTYAEVAALPKNSSMFGREKFSQEVAYFLIGQNMNKYLDTFRGKNISFQMLFNLTEKDLKLLGIEDADDRQKLLDSIRMKGGIRANDEGVPPVPLNPVEDLLIARAIAEQSQAISKNLSFLLQNLKNSNPQDYHIAGPFTGLGLAKIVAEKAIQQTQIMQTSIYRPGSGGSLIDKILEKAGHPLPTRLKRKLLRKKKLRKSAAILLATSGIAILAILVRSFLGR